MAVLSFIIWWTATSISAYSVDTCASILAGLMNIAFVNI